MDSGPLFYGALFLGASLQCPKQKDYMYFAVTGLVGPNVALLGSPDPSPAESGD